MRSGRKPRVRSHRVGGAPGARRARDALTRPRPRPRALGALLSRRAEPAGRSKNDARTARQVAGPARGAPYIRVRHALRDAGPGRGRRRDSRLRDVAPGRHRPGVRPAAHHPQRRFGRGQRKEERRVHRGGARQAGSGGAAARERRPADRLRRAADARRAADGRGLRPLRRPARGRDAVDVAALVSRRAKGPVESGGEVVPLARWRKGARRLVDLRALRRRRQGADRSPS